MSAAGPPQGLGLRPRDMEALLAALDRAVIDGSPPLDPARVAGYLRRHAAPVVSDGYADVTTLDGAAPAVRPSTQVDVRTAAQRLGIGAHAVRKRLVAGKLAGHKLSGVWLVELEEEPTRG